jgi:hypothetical protein
MDSKKALYIIYLFQTMACVILCNSPHEPLIMKVQRTPGLCAKDVPSNGITATFVYRILLVVDNALRNAT